MRFSASRLSTWMSCPLQAKFRYVDNLPTRQSGKASFGTIIHHALELYNQTGDLELAVREFKDHWKNPNKLGVDPDYWPRSTTYGGLMLRGEEILREYHDKVKWEERVVVGTEHKFLVPFGDHELTGMVDLLEARRDKRGRLALRIIDYKTNTKQPYTTELKINVQFSVYTYASLQPEFWEGNGPDFPPLADGPKWFQELEDVRRQPIWYHLWTNKEMDAGQRDERDFMRLYRACHEIQRAFDEGIFVPNISGDSCTWCDYIEPCGIGYKKEPENDD